MSAKQYLKMADVFIGDVIAGDDDLIRDADGLIGDMQWPSDCVKYAAHAINSHDELVESRDMLLYQLEEIASIVRQNTYPQPDKPNSTWGSLVEAEAVIRKIKGGEA